jgi:hypothetical protein
MNGVIKWIIFVFFFFFFNKAVLVTSLRIKTILLFINSYNSNMLEWCYNKANMFIYTKK